MLHTEGKLGIKRGPPSDPGGPPSLIMREERREDKERQKKVGRMCVRSRSASWVKSFLGGSFQIFRAAERRTCYWQLNKAVTCQTAGVV